MTQLTSSDALLIVDLQRDFLPGGALAVPDGDAVIPVLNAYLERFVAAGCPVFATRDWHPPDHCSFTEQGGSWPVHCVANTPGAAFPAELALPDDVIVISKATQPQQEAYSGFEGTELAQKLRQAGVRRLFVGGLATDYCVLNTVIDACHEGFEVLLLEDAVQAINRKPDDGDYALQKMQAACARLRTLETFDA